MPAAAATVTDPTLAALLAWWDEHARPLPWRATRDVYAIWVSEMMSIQTTIERAAAAWEGWMQRWPTVEALAAASLSDVLGQWQGLGYPRRARDLHRGARQVVASGWPADLTELPGVGPYVGAAIACFAFERPTLPRDVNVARVLERRFPEGLAIDDDPWRSGQAIMEFGQRICTARPRCGSCPVREGCAGLDALAGGAQRQPRSRRRARERFDGSLRQRRGALLARVLADGAVPLAEVDAEAAASLAADGLVTVANGRVSCP